ncbi:MAG: Flp pilus assembly protein CpaB [Gaiellaceae bacterium]
MTYRIRTVSLAIGLALVGALLVTLYVTNYKKHVQQGEQSVQVYVAAHDIAVGTPGKEIAAGKLLVTHDVARRSVVPGAISSPDQVANLTLTQPVYAGEQVTLRRFGSAKQLGVRSDLKGTLRAVQVSGDSTQLLVGTLKAGDHVDLVGNFKPDSGTPFTKIVLRNLDVLKGPTESLAGAKVGGTAGQTSVLLAVRDRQVQKLFFTLQNGDWTLELRPAAEATDSPEVVESYASILASGLRRG